jgi:acetoacetate decarboxylase
MEELVIATTSDAEFSGIWRGEAELGFHDVSDPDLVTLAPVETGAGYLFSYAETLAPGRRVRVTTGSARPPAVAHLGSA